MDQVVGRAAGGQQGDHGVDNAALINQTADGREVWALDQRQHGARRLARQISTHALAGVDEGGAGHMQAHGFEQHLVAVGGAIKGAGAFAVVGLRLGLEQLGAAHQALRCLFAHLGFFAVGQAAGHGASRHKHGG